MPEEQPVGDPLPGWQPRPRPPRSSLTGQWCTVEAFDPSRHGAQLHAELADPTLWAYMKAGPFATERELLAAHADSEQRVVHVLCRSGRALGTASYLRINREDGSIEIGSICLAPAVQRSRALSEAMYLLLGRAFDELGYRRVEWKCNALNAPSRAAADRLGFVFEGIFRQAEVTKGRNRDTAWYSMLDREWPARRTALDDWLRPANFDSRGVQRMSLERAARS